MELSLKLMTAISTNCVESEREFLDDIVDEIDCILLGMPLVDLQCSDAGCIIDSGVLESTDSLSFSIFEPQELDIDLYMMTWNCLGVTLSVDCSTLSRFWQAIHPVTGKNDHRRLNLPYRIASLTNVTQM